MMRTMEVAVCEVTVCPGHMGKHLARCSAEQLDRVITARLEEWNDGATFRDDDGSCCLVGHTCGASGPAAVAWYSSSSIRNAALAAGAYPLAVQRFGKERVVRALQMRAAKLLGSDARTIAQITEPVIVPEPQPELQEVV